MHLVVNISENFPRIPRNVNHKCCQAFIYSSFELPLFRIRFKNKHIAKCKQIKRINKVLYTGEQIQVTLKNTIIECFVKPCSILALNFKEFAFEYFSVMQQGRIFLSSIFAFRDNTLYLY